MRHLGDITKINGAEIEPVWCITGGSPCQDLSIAGKRAGLAGARSGLFMEQVRIVKEMRAEDIRNGRTGNMVRPRFLVWENVVGAFSSNKGQDFAAVLEEIIKIVEPEAPSIEVPEKGWPSWGGYHDEVGGRWSVVWRTHDAQYWGKTIRDSRTGDVLQMGTPQRRRRISVVADFGGDAAGEILFERESLLGHIAESGAAGEGLAETAEIGVNPAVGDCMTAGDRHGVMCMTPWDTQSARVYDQDGVWHSLNANENGGMSRDSVLCAGFKLGNSEQARSIGYAEETSPTLNAECGGNKPAVVAPAVMAFATNQREEVRDIGEKSVALASEPGMHCQTFVAQTSAVMAFDTTQITSKENGSKPEFGKPCHRLNANAHVPCVALDMTHACDVIRECGEQVPALQARMGTGGNQVPLTYQDVAGTLSPGAHAGSYNGQDAYNDMLVFGTENPDVSHTLRAKANCAYREDAETYPVQNMVVRRLTPLECTRLQGYPDGWVDIGDWVDEQGKKHKETDSPKYKALGNSIALPFWQWMIDRMAKYLPENATLGSLFDGIGGFPLCFERTHGKGSARWASEIEPFPIAVTKMRFGEE